MYAYRMKMNHAIILIYGSLFCLKDFKVCTTEMSFSQFSVGVPGDGNSLQFPDKELKLKERSKAVAGAFLDSLMGIFNAKN